MDIIYNNKTYNSKIIYNNKTYNSKILYRDNNKGLHKNI